MVLKKVLFLVAITVVVGSASVALCGIPDVYLSTATRAYNGPETTVMFNVPNGGGTPFTDSNSSLIPSFKVDSTITLHLVDAANTPIANYPYQDLWIESRTDCDPCMSRCIQGTVADANTDALGMTTWVTPLRAGGSSQALTVVMVASTPLMGPGLAISHNSTDINGDGYVNLPDVGIFATDFYSGFYQFRSDFHYDGMVNLSDVSELSDSIGAACP